MNLAKFIRATPAGTLMNVRITGSRREKKTAASPWRSNQSWALSISCGRIKRYRPKRSRSGRPPHAPAPYAIHDPTRLPAVPARPTQSRLSSRPSPTKPVLASAPPNSIVTSDGMGTAADSSSMRTKIAR